MPHPLIPNFDGLDVLSVTGITDYVQALLEDDPQLQSVWVEGEVSSAKLHPSGLFFTLAEDEPSRVAIACVTWRSQLARLNVQPTAGERVLVLGTVQLYRVRGDYRLHVVQVLPAGAGLAALRLQQLRDRLAAEGLFERDRKRPLPAHPHTIAVVTSATAAAWGDIQRTLGQRYPGLRVRFAPATVQGDRAPVSMVAAIERVVADGQAQVLILARGGGATEDLSCFNDERLVRAIAACPIPIITGIGHERDQSLADLVADHCAHTPTAAAEQVVPTLADVALVWEDWRTELARVMGQRLQQERDRLGQLRHRLQRLRPDRQLARETERVQWLRQRLHRAIAQRLQLAQEHQTRLRSQLLALDPAAVLQRGYAVVHRAEAAPSHHSTPPDEATNLEPSIPPPTTPPTPTTIIRTLAQVQPGDILTVQLATGQFQVTVTAVPPVD
jgi:exodeoxyribonuclease VII large subunit